MSQIVRETQETTSQVGDTVQSTQRTVDPQGEKAHRQNVITRVIWFILGIINVLLALRFLFVLLGANAQNGLANFIYDITHPLVSPFFSLFNYQYVGNDSRFEIYTLVAIVIYTLIGWGLAKLATITRD